MGKTVNSVKSDIDVKRILSKYAKNWYFFAISLIIAFLFARDSNRYIVPQYSLKTSVLIEDKSNASVLQEKGNISAAPMFLSSKLIDNQIALLKSYGQIKKIIEKLDFEVSYYEKGEYIWNEIYKNSPFIIEFDKNHKQPRYKRINVRFISSGTFELSSDETSLFNKSAQYKTGALIASKDYSFRLVLKDSINPSELVNHDWSFKINEINGLVAEYMGKTNVYVENGPSILIISTTGTNKEKEKDYLNQLTREFLQSNLDKKNEILSNIITFIEAQIVQFKDELSVTEQQLEDFRKTYQFMQLEEKVGSLLKNLDSESKDKKNFLIDLEYYNYLLNYVKEREDLDDMVMPSSMGYNLPMFNELSGRLSKKIQERDNLLANSTDKNPYIQVLNREIEVMKASLVESITTVITSVDQKVNSTDYRMWSLNDEFLKLPGIEREYIAIMRKFKIIDNLYDFLLRRKAEVEIQRAANTPDHEIIDFAGESGISNVSKNPKSAYINAIIWAILLPAIFLFLIVFLNNRVMADEDITSNTPVTLIGSIANSPSDKSDVVLRSPNSYFTELFRIIRIKLNLKPENREQLVIITSSSVEEGKSFFAINFASVYALTGKKALFIGFDFRSPNELADFNLNPDTGITSYLVNNLPIEQVIQKTYTKNLDILLSGPIPPNPDELIESDKTKMMFDDLRNKYDYIIIDTPPIGLFGDAFLLNKYCDATLFIVRHNFTRKKEFVSAINEAVENQMNRLSIVYNDADIRLNERNIRIYGEEAPKRFILFELALNFRRKIINFLRKI